jgi:hypothetical protein
MKRFYLALFTFGAAFLTVNVFAERNPDYAEDLGPATIDVSQYPADMQRGYKIMEAKCIRCHTTARAVNSPWVDTKDWARYINRMRLRPPCCNQCPVVSLSDAKASHRFMVYDSHIRKTGPREAEWKQFREQLMNEFRRKYPKQYAQRYLKNSTQKGEKP